MFIKDQVIDFYSMSTIDKRFDMVETAVNKYLQHLDIVEDLFYTFCAV